MDLSVRTNAGIAKASAMIAGGNPGIVGESELMKTAKAILSGSTGVAGVNSSNTYINRAVSNVDVKLYDAGFNPEAVRQAATNRTGYDVNLSFNAIESINALKAQAAKMQIQNLSGIVDGKIHINAERPETASLKDAFSSNTNFLEVFNSSNTNKDRKGPGGFYIPLQKGENDKEEGLNIVI